MNHLSKSVVRDTEGAAKQKPHATFCGNWGWATAPGDPVAGLTCPAPLTHLLAYASIVEAMAGIAAWLIGDRHVVRSSWG